MYVCPKGTASGDRTPSLPRSKLRHSQRDGAMRTPPRPTSARCACLPAANDSQGSRSSEVRRWRTFGQAGPARLAHKREENTPEPASAGGGTERDARRSEQRDVAREQPPCRLPHGGPQAEAGDCYFMGIGTTAMTRALEGLRGHNRKAAPIARRALGCPRCISLKERRR